MKQVYKMLRAVVETEDVTTKRLFVELAEVKERGYLTKTEFIKILKWKSPRPLKHYSQNTAAEIKAITKHAFAADNDALKIHILTALKGVKYPSASAILMFYDPKRFAVLDIRVWQQLHRLGVVQENKNGQAFTYKQCEQFLNLIRLCASEMKLTARQVEKRLFDYDVDNRLGKLYRY